jgi:lipopolysaccharide transport system permease protein
MSAPATDIPMRPASAPEAASVPATPADPDRPDREAAVPDIVIEPRKGWINVDWAEMKRSRELLFFLVWRDIKVRYKQATLGILWAVLQPLTQVIVFSAIFGAGLNMASMLSGPIKEAYPVFVFSGLLVWQLFARSMSEGGMSLVNQQHLLTKIYFPRLFVPTASVGGALFDLLVSIPIFIAMMAIYRVSPLWTVIFFPLLVAQTVVLGSGMAYLLSALTVTYRDFRFIIPFLVQIWMWMSFVMFPVPDKIATNPKWQALFAVNPMYGIVSTVRKVMLGQGDRWNAWHLVYSVLITAAVFVFGMFYFRRTERRFADIA